MDNKQVKLQIKEVGEQGRFTGLAAVYGNRDLGGDVILPGAFTKTISDNGGKFPLLYGHKVNVGVSVVQDSPEGLLTEGFLNLEKQVARDVYSDLKFFRDNGMDFGMSIGYKPVPDKTEFKNDTRYIKEIKLFENTLTEIPMNQRARVQDVKGFEDLEEAVEFIAELKAGRKISKARAERLRSAANEILSLLSEAGVEEATTSEGADDKGIEPVAVKDHSALSSIITTFRKELYYGTN